MTIIVDIVDMQMFESLQLFNIIGFIITNR